jgi:hypothetical protein
VEHVLGRWQLRLRGRAPSCRHDESNPTIVSTGAKNVVRGDVLVALRHPLKERVVAIARSVPQRRLLRLAWSVGLVAVVGASAGCGRRATREDCQLIVDRSVELQLRETSETDPKTIAAREAAVRTALDGEIKSCERDRRVTEKTMNCVRSASTTEELDKCLR